LSIEHPEKKAFSDEEVQWVELLAAQAAVSIDNARQYNELQETLVELRQTRLQVDARSALALMSMATNQWRHIIEGHAININNNVTLLRQELESLFVGQPVPAGLEEKLRRIENLAIMIEEKPITPPLSSEEGLADILIHDLIYERLYQLWANEPYRSVQREILFKTEYAALVRASSEWLRRAFDIIIDNAVDELQNVPPEQRSFTVTTRQAGQLLEIEFADTGRGIPEDVRNQLFRKRVEKTGSQKGLGMGLLMAQVIIETYNGTIAIQANQPTGTKVIIRLPYWQSPYIAE
jgi:signal transduction histidine kinase